MVSAFDSRVVLTGNADNKLMRLPGEVLRQVERLTGLSYHTSGIRARFITDSGNIRIMAEVSEIATYSHMPISAHSGYDIYVNNVFRMNVRPAYGEIKFDETIDLQTEKKMNLIDIYFPLYNSVKEFSFQLEEDSLLKRAEEPKKPILFYGSSVTQGGCASRPGNSYTSMLARLLDRNTINLGFSGNAKGDLPVADYIASLDLAAFVCDYDHNAPDTKWLKATHEPFFKRIREKKPDLPIILMSRHDYDRWGIMAEENRAVVITTYMNAYNSGDRNVYFIDGRMMFGAYGRDRCTVDGVHCNDVGFERMAESVYPVLKDILEER